MEAGVQGPLSIIGDGGSIEEKKDRDKRKDQLLADCEGGMGSFILLSHPRLLPP